MTLSYELPCGARFLSVRSARDEAREETQRERAGRANISQVIFHPFHSSSKLFRASFLATLRSSFHRTNPANPHNVVTDWHGCVLSLGELYVSVDWVGECEGECETASEQFIQAMYQIRETDTQTVSLLSHCESFASLFS